MRFGCNNFNYFLKNKLTKLANFGQFKRMLMFFLEDWRGAWPLGPLPLATPLDRTAKLFETPQLTKTENSVSINNN